MSDEYPPPFGMYECDSCGACCRGGLVIEADAIDTRREPRILQCGVGKPMTQGEIESDDFVVLLGCGKPCGFLGADNRCGIYATRPHDCVAFDAGSEKCQEQRAAYGIPPLLPRHQCGENLEAIRERMSK